MVDLKLYGAGFDPLITTLESFKSAVGHAKRPSFSPRTVLDKLVTVQLTIPVFSAKLEKKYPQNEEKKDESEITTDNDT